MTQLFKCLRAVLMWLGRPSHTMTDWVCWDNPDRMYYSLRFNNITIEYCDKRNDIALYDGGDLVITLFVDETVSFEAWTFAAPQVDTSSATPLAPPSEDHTVPF